MVRPTALSLATAVPGLSQLVRPVLADVGVADIT